MIIIRLWSSACECSHTNFPIGWIIRWRNKNRYLFIPIFLISNALSSLFSFVSFSLPWWFAWFVLSINDCCQFDFAKCGIWLTRKCSIWNTRTVNASPFPAQAKFQTRNKHNLVSFIYRHHSVELCFQTISICLQTNKSDEFCAVTKVAFLFGMTNHCKRNAGQSRALQTKLHYCLLPYNVWRISFPSIPEPQLASYSLRNQITLPWISQHAE